jgi:transcriptional regulator with XRE-family HTH domain
LHPSGHFLKVARLNRGWTQAELAEHSGVDASHISAIENGRAKGKVRVWKRLADALDMQVSQFIPPEQVTREQAV